MNSEAKIMSTLRSNNSFITSPEPVNIPSSKSPTPSPCPVTPIPTQVITKSITENSSRSANLASPSLSYFDITASANTIKDFGETETDIKQTKVASSQPTKVASSSRSWIGSDMISKITKSKSSALKQSKKLLAEKEETIQSQSKEIQYLRNELEKYRRLLKTKDAKICQMEDILTLKRTEVETNLLVEAAEKEDKKKAEQKKDAAEGEFIR